jgi:hypothetical protein
MSKWIISPGIVISNSFSIPECFKDWIWLQSDQITEKSNQMPVWNERNTPVEDKMKQWNSKG